MVKRNATHLLLRPEDIRPSHPDWEVIGVFNPAVARYDGQTILLARVAERPREQHTGRTAVPRWAPKHGYVVDWLESAQLNANDPRVVRHRQTGLVRLTFISHFQVARSRDGRTIESIDGPAMLPNDVSEEFGVEDPRITWLDGRYYITYVAVSRHGAATALASTVDFQTFTRHGIILPPENKDVVLLPERVDGQYVALHRPVGDIPFCRPQMWLARSPDLIHWGSHQFLYGGIGQWEDGRVGAGAPPIAAADGWLEIYHGNRRSRQEGGIGAYCGGALLLAKNDPTHVLKAGIEPILEPAFDFENEGFVNRVVFPTGVVAEDDQLLVYYGASDKYCGMVEIGLQEVVGGLR